jgi:hypothetical protein
MDHATEAYAAWGRGDIEDADLQAILTELLPGEDVL